MTVEARLLQDRTIWVQVSNGGWRDAMKFQSVEQMVELASALKHEAQRIEKMMPQRPRYIEKQLFS